MWYKFSRRKSREGIAVPKHTHAHISSFKRLQRIRRRRATKKKSKHREERRSKSYVFWFCRARVCRAAGCLYIYIYTVTSTHADMQTLAPLYGSSHENGINRNKQYAICVHNFLFFFSPFPVKWNSRNPVGLTHTTRQSKDMHMANRTFFFLQFAAESTWFVWNSL